MHTWTHARMQACTHARMCTHASTQACTSARAVRMCVYAFCDQCEYVAKKFSQLKDHQKAKHDGIRYPCDQCEYTAMKISNLKAHKEYME